MKKLPVLLASNFLSASGGSRGVCEELAMRLECSGTRVIKTSDRPARLSRLIDMVHTTWRERRNYAVAQVDVFSGPAFFWAEAVCAMLKVLHKPFILTLHGGNLPAFAKKHPWRVRRLFRSANVVTTPSNYLYQAMSEVRRDLRLVPNALDLSRYAFRLREHPSPTLVWLRAFHQIYNPLLAVSVLGLLLAENPKARLIMIGPDKEDGTFQQTKDLAMQLNLAGHLCLTGGVDKREVPALLNSGDIFLNTTNVDNAPVSVLEAMACGLCVVSTNVGGLPFLLSDGKDGLMVKPDDKDAMADAAKRILKNSALATQISQGGRALAEKQDWAAILPQWEGLFHEVCGAGAGQTQSCS